MTNVSLKHLSRFSLIFCLAGAALLGGCREGEQERAIKLEKGSYQGKADTPLTPENRKALRQRGQYQAR